MARFKKLIVTPGAYKVGRLDGSTDIDAFTPERLKKLVEETNKLLALGVSIPSPFMHQDKGGHFPLPVIVGNDGASLQDALMAYSGEKLAWDASINGGFWNKFEIDPETGGLLGSVEAPGDENDLSTPAGKFGKTVKETSILTMPARKVRDKEGKEHEIGEHIAHVAACLHPVLPGQANFIPVEKGSELAAAMSICMANVVGGSSSLPATGYGAGPATAADIQKDKDPEMAVLLDQLRNLKDPIDLPDTCDRDNLVPALILALRQKLADQQAQAKLEVGTDVRPPDAQTKSPSIAMSTTVTPAPATPTAADRTLSIVMGQMVKDRKAKLKERIKNLVGTGRISASYADNKLYPLVEAVKMSAADIAEDGSLTRTQLDDLIEGLEEANPLAGESITEGNRSIPTPKDGHVIDVPEDSFQELTNEQMEGILQEPAFAL